MDSEYLTLIRRLAGSAEVRIAVTTLAIAMLADGLGSPVVLPLCSYAALVPFEGILAVGVAGTLTRYLAFAASVVMWADRLLFAKGRILKPPRAVWGWALFLALAAASSLWAWSPDATFSHFFSISGLFLLYFSAAVYPFEQKHLTWLKASIVVGGLLAAAFAVLLYAQGSVWAGSGSRATLTLGAGRGSDPNRFATSLLVPLLLSVEWLILSKGWRRWLAVASGGGIFLGLLLTASRSGVASAVAALLLFFWRLRDRVDLRSAILIGAAIAVVACAAFAAASDYLAARFSLEDILRWQGAGRFNIWRIGLAAFGHEPILGYGYENFPYAYDYFRPLVPTPRDMGPHRPAHNIYLQTFVELGVIGGLLLLAVLWQHWRLTRSLVHHGTLSAATLEAMLVAVCVAGLVLGNLYWKDFWLALTYIVVVANVQRRSEGEVVWWRQ